MTTAAGLQAEIDKTQEQIRVLTKARENRRQQITEIESERRKWLIAARVAGDPGAQEETEKRSQQIAILREGDTLDYAALAELEEQLKQQRSKLSQHLQRVHHREVLALVQSRQKAGLEVRVLRLATELKEAAEEISASDGKISRAVHALGGDFIDEANLFGNRQRDLQNTIQFTLRTVIDVGPVGFHGKPAEGYESLFGKLEQRLRKVTDASEQAV